jgi:hypothetical protein
VGFQLVLFISSSHRLQRPDRVSDSDSQDARADQCRDGSTPSEIFADSESVDYENG